jgi:hypothetical protein
MKSPSDWRNPQSADAKAICDRLESIFWSIDSIDRATNETAADVADALKKSR